MTYELSLSVNNLMDFSIYEEASHGIQRKGKLPFVEILWDNYCHLEPEKLMQYMSRFSDRIAFHIMWSRFLDRDEEEFQEFLQRLKFHVDEINPLYISDHICTFRVGSTYTKAGLEHDYIDVDEISRRVDRYQQYLGRQILFENFASMTLEGYKQAEFFDILLTQTGCGALFDISNARVAEHNGFSSLRDWIQLFSGIEELRCHVGGYEYLPDFQCYRDSHADPISGDTLSDIRMVLTNLNVKSLCYEREHNRIGHEMARDLSLIQTKCWEE